MNPRDKFILEVSDLIRRTEAGPSFRGKTQALRELRRLLTRSYLGK